MFLISWNVAGWSSTSAAIRESYGSVEAFFALSGADIICIQECKGTWGKLEADPVAMGASDPPLKKRKQTTPVVPVVVASDGAPDARPALPTKETTESTSSLSSASLRTSGIEGWESFWALSSPKHRGFNGVVTFARKGLTWRCNNAPFGDPELDDEGRVVVTHHCSFVLVNVYVPNARGGERLALKFRFLERLRAHMDDLRRETGKPVILVGDLNMTYRRSDASWGLQRVGLAMLLALLDRAAGVIAACGGDGPAADAAWDKQCLHLPLSTLRRLSNAIANALTAQLVEAVRSATVDSVIAPHTERGSDVGASVVSVDTPTAVLPDVALCLARAREVVDRVEASSGGEPVSLVGGLNFANPAVTLAELYDCGFRSVFADTITANVQPTHNREVFALLQYCGLPPHGHESVRYLSSLLHESGWGFDADPARDGLQELRRSEVRMVDTFRLGEAEAPAAGSAGYCPCPFTCWDQSRNKRLTNEGTRLDYILVDSELAPLVVPRGNTPNNTGFSLAVDHVGDVTASRHPSGSVSSPLKWLTSAQQIFVRQPATVQGNVKGDESGQKVQTDFFSTFAGTDRVDSVCRAMADGLYPPAPYDRSGLPPLQDAARGCAFCGLPSTGLFVTPPQLSDHIGVCALFLSKGKSDSAEVGLDLLPRPDKLVEESGKCAYRPPIGLQSFFVRAALRTPTEATASLSAFAPTSSASPLAKPLLDTKSPTEAGAPRRKAEKREGGSPRPREGEVVDVDGD